MKAPDHALVIRSTTQVAIFTLASILLRNAVAP
jgi:hypothetical protein